jgi:Family of unknown function (DUF6962)
MLAEPAPSLTDLALGLVALVLALQLRRLPAVHRHWQTAFWWFGAAALGGAVYHGAVVRWTQAAQVGWAVISVAVVIAVSSVLAGTVVMVLGPGRVRTFWLLRAIGIVAYVALAVTGRAGIGGILVCESLTMASVLALWLWAAHRSDPFALPMLLAIAASGAAAAANLASDDLLRPVGLDPTSAYHLAQIAGLVLLYLALAAVARAEAGEWGSRPRHGVVGSG